ncbi:MAG: tetratricopeptide repeat protein [Gammaproteobacteria bacterium]|nr:tetratricopeptide repeat protein [Gammaproteobacteria bacterium]MCI0590064.1 tetratricopeptide repeat protein [Gammaproteobacteria bacterium]
MARNSVGVRILILYLALLLLSGCAGELFKAQRVSPDTATLPTTRGEARATPVRPPQELTQEILYKLLVAEIAGQRGQLDLAVNSYLELARSIPDPQLAERATRIAVLARQDDKAQEAAGLWVSADPDNMEARQVRAALSIRVGDTDEALRELQYLLAIPGGDPSQKLWMIANLLGREKDQQAALAVMRKLVAERQDDPEALAAYANLAARVGHYDEARSALEQVLVLDPDNFNAAMTYVSVLERDDDVNGAVAWLEDRLNKRKNDFNLRMAYARLLTDAKRYDEARAQFEMLNAQSPGNADVLYALGLLYLQDNQLDKAAQYLDQMVNQGQRVYEGRYYLGRIAEEKRDYESATNWYMGVEHGENYFDAQVRLALLLAKQGNVEDARAHLNAIQIQDPHQQTILVQAEGEILTTEGRYADAMEVYDRALDNNFDPELLYSRAMLAEKMDRLDILERDLREILQHDPDNAQALNALGYTLADRTDRYQEAYELIKRAHDLSPDDYYILDSYGWVLYRLGRHEEAVTYLRQARAIRDDPEIAAHLGEVLWVMGNKDGAHEVWESALQTTPDDERLLDVIKRFNR